MDRHIEQAEPILDPGRPIVDPHHHLWLRPTGKYLFDEFLADIQSGHNIVATVYVECGSMYRASGRKSFAQVGEAEFFRGGAAMGSSGTFGETRFCEAFVGYADLRRADILEELIQQMQEASGHRLRGIRQSATWDANNKFSSPRHQAPPTLMADPRFRAGLARIASLGLTFDAVLYQPQLPELVDLARAVPRCVLVLDHSGGIVGAGTYAGRRDELFVEWRKSMKEVAELPNVVVKLGGLGMPHCGFGFDERIPKPASDELAANWKPYVETCIELFGPQRCMFESNFPADRQSCSYASLWNAFKVITIDYSAEEKDTLFADTAARVYRLSPGDARAED
jgi:L-fuconolactonase